MDTLTRSRGAASTRSLHVAWLGADARVLGGGEAGEVHGLEVRYLGTDAELDLLGNPPDVIHVATGASLAHLRRRFPQTALVLDPGSVGSRLGFRARREARLADAIVVKSVHELRKLRSQHPELTDRTSLVRRPIDLEEHAPLTVLQQGRDAELKRFRRFYRLAEPTILFAGPYTDEGGLDRAIHVVQQLRERRPELRLAAIPEGKVDQRYRDRCERAALSLGHRAVVEWTCGASEAPLWYALATVVCLPCRTEVVSDAPALAGAAARPFVGSDVSTLADEVAEGQTGYLVAENDLETLEAAIEALVGDEDEARRIGEAGRARAEQERSPAAVLRQLGHVWRDALATRSAAAVGPLAMQVEPQTR